MKMFNKKDFMEVKTWVYRHARPLELAVWKYNYEKGSHEAVLEALSYYQNGDGGFGNGIEPDCWNDESSPYATLKAVALLRKTQIMDMIGIDHPMVQGILSFLDSGAFCDENGWYFCIPSNDNFPRAPWWTYSEESNRVQSMGITAALCAFILRYGADWPKLYARAENFAGKILNTLANTEDYGEMGVDGIMVLLGDIAHCGLTESFACGGIMEKLVDTVNHSIERDPANWQYYTPRPSSFIWSKESPFYSGNEAIVETQLDYLIDTRRPAGVWNITWSWFDLGEMYSKEFAVSETWWMSDVAMGNLEFLYKFGRIEMEEGQQ